MKIRTFLNASYPLNASYLGVIRNAALVWLFLVIFLPVFQPFGLSSIPGPFKILKIALFSLPSVPVVLLIDSIITYLARHHELERKWKVWHEIVLFSVMSVCIGGANYLLAWVMFELLFSWTGFFRMQLYTGAISFFPIVGFIFLGFIRLSKRHALLAAHFGRTDVDTIAEEKTLSPGDSIVTLRGENNDESIALSLQDLYFCKSEANYVEVVSEDQTNGIKSCLLRSSLKGIEQQLKPHGNKVIRCHRSYLVNKGKIHSAKGNAQGLSLYFEGIKQTVPVSRAYVGTFKNP